MNTPPFLIGVALLFWGWQTGHFIIGLLAALFLEGVRQVDTRWEISEMDYRRIWDLCSVLFVGLFFYFYASEGITDSAFQFMQWLPMMFLPIMAAQWLGTRERLGWRVFSILLRRRPGEDPPDAGLHVAYPFFAICLLATSATKPDRVFFYPGFCGLMAWVLWVNRNRRFPVWLWAMFLSAVVIAGFDSQRRLHELQSVMENRFNNWIFSFVRRDSDIRESQTALGRIGRVKLSNRIMWRLKAEGTPPPPSLLREASFNTFRYNTWYATGKSFQSVLPEADDAWTLLANKRTNSTLSVAGYLPGGKGVLVLPQGVARIEHMPAMEMERNGFGAVRVSQGPGFVQYRALHGLRQAMDDPPNEDDLKVPEGEKEAVRQVAEALKLGTLDHAMVKKTIERYFESQYTYTTDLTINTYRRRSQDSAVSRFLLKVHKGHCEYFASATVLLLRQVGIPARYATGYSVSESNGQNQFIVRERHGHAWCLVWNPAIQIWEEFDTTPAGWEALEAQAASIFQPLGDAWSRIWFEFNRWRYSKTNFRIYAFYAAGVVAVVLAIRILLGKRKSRSRSSKPAAPTSATWSGIDSEFYLLEHTLAECYAERREGETLFQWFDRIEKMTQTDTRPWRDLAWLHYRLRFDPSGLTVQERDLLRTQCEASAAAIVAASQAPPSSQAV